VQKCKGAKGAKAAKGTKVKVQVQVPRCKKSAGAQEVHRCTDEDKVCTR